MLWEPTRSDVITILGCGPSIYDWINYNCKDFPADDQIWVVNPGARLFYHHVAFDMHDQPWIDKMDKERLRRRRAWMASHNKPIVMPQALPEIPTSVTYPLHRVVSETKSNYFADGTSYMFAMAYLLKPKVLRVFGADYSFNRQETTHTEPGEKCANYWIGRIKESGVQVEMSKNTHLMDQAERSKGFFYGYSEAGKWTFDEQGRGTLTNLNYADQS
jgi:hypothetical protein